MLADLGNKRDELVVAGEELATAQQNYQTKADAYDTAKTNFDGAVQAVSSAASDLTGCYDGFLQP